MRWSLNPNDYFSLSLVPHIEWVLSAHVSQVWCHTTVSTPFFLFLHFSSQRHTRMVSMADSDVMLSKVSPTYTLITPTGIHPLDRPLPWCGGQRSKLVQFKCWLHHTRFQCPLRFFFFLFFLNNEPLGFHPTYNNSCWWNGNLTSGALYTQTVAQAAEAGSRENTI